LEGKNLAIAMAMIVAGASLLSYIQNQKTEQASRSIFESVFESIHAGETTPDLGGRLETTDFTDGVINRVKAKLEVWKGLRSKD
jgi:isocitrate/isopropylmalate dehydrogenase